jgi:WD40 repeat protein
MDRQDVKWAPSGAWILSASQDKTLKIWDPKNGKLVFSTLVIIIIIFLKKLHVISFFPGNSGS